MRLVCAIQDLPPLRYFVNRVHEVRGVDLVVLETPHGGVAGKLTELGVRGAGRSLVRKVRGRSAVPQTLDHWFGDRWKALDPEIPILVTPSVNDEAVVSRLEELAPVTFLDHGTTLVRPRTLAPSTLALNLHWGLSPHYRGVECTKWALIGWDPLNIGMTVHQLTQEIDGGGIVAQDRAKVTAADTAHSINMQLTYVGTEIVLEALDRYRRTSDLPLVEQDLSAGLVTYKRQWSSLLQRHVERMERDGTIGRMLEAPVRRERLPIIERTVLGPD